MRALLKFELLGDVVDLGAGCVREVYTPIYLYRESDGLVWRIGGPYGDELVMLPKPRSVTQAKLDARAVFKKNDPFFKPRAKWL